MLRQGFSQALLRVLGIVFLYPAQGRPESFILAGLFQYCKSQTVTSQVTAFEEFCCLVLFIVQGLAELYLDLFFVFKLGKHWQ